ncbi:MAG TPA: ABC transporter permease, partial [Bryobacteraceae bacterium]|nr:ABC transporter permease [Bryobacteraceae bacterium]
MKLRSWFLLPARVWVALFFAAPLAIICAYSFLTRGDYGGVEQPWTIESYTRLADPLYLAILWRSLWIAGLATALCVALGFPLALFISRAGKRKNLYLQLVLLPFWTSFLVRTYAWLFILRDTGLINTVLSALHIIKSPLPLLYNDGAVLLGLVYSFLPFFVLPMYATLERLDPALAEAAADLGAPPWRTLWRVVIPVSKPGIVAGAALVFIPCLGAYLTPDLLGGGKSVMLGNLVQNQFTTARDWPFGSAASLALMLASAILLVVLLTRRET